MRLKRIHKIALQEKDARIGEALRTLRVRQSDFDLTVNEIKLDLEIPKEELEKWTLSQDGEAIEEIPEPKKPEKPPGEKETQDDKKDD